MATKKELEDAAKKKMVPVDPGIPGLPGIPELPGIPRKPNQKPPRLTKGYADGGVVEGDWDKIKNWVVGKEKPAFAAGGQVNGVSGLPGELDLQQLLGAAQPPAVAPPMALPEPQMPPAATINPSAPLSKPPTSLSPTASQIMGGGAAKRSQLAQQASQRSLGDKLSLLGGGIGDAFTRASGMGDSGFAKSIEDAQGAREAGILANFDKESALTQEEFGLQQKLDAQDPNSDLSKLAQNTYGALLSKSGFKPQDIAKMPASLIADLTGKSVDAMKAESEALMAKATLGLNERKFASDTEAKEEEAKRKALEALGKRGMFKKLGDFVTGDSDETRALKEQAGLQTPAPTPTISVFDDAKKQRLAELRAKRDAGQLR